MAGAMEVCSLWLGPWRYVVYGWGHGGMQSTAGAMEVCSLRLGPWRYVVYGWGHGGM